MSFPRYKMHHSPEYKNKKEQNAAESGHAVQSPDHDENLSLEGFDEPEHFEDAEQAKRSQHRNARVAGIGQDLEDADEDDEGVEKVEGVLDVAVEAVRIELEEHFQREHGREKEVG